MCLLEPERLDLAQEPGKRGGAQIVKGAALPGRPLEPIPERPQVGEGDPARRRELIAGLEGLQRRQGTICRLQTCGDDGLNMPGASLSAAVLLQGRLRLPGGVHDGRETRPDLPRLVHGQGTRHRRLLAARHLSEQAEVAAPSWSAHTPDRAG